MNTPVKNLYTSSDYDPYTAVQQGADIALLRMQPTLDLFPNREPVILPENIAPRLYLVPKPDLINGEEPDPENPPKPSPLKDLPDLTTWVTRYVISTIEILGARRSAAQLARWCHRLVYSEMQSLIGIFETLPKIRRIYISQPHDGIAETVVTIRISERVRTLVMRFEGVDQRWLCTELTLL